MKLVTGPSMLLIGVIAINLGACGSRDPAQAAANLAKPLYRAEGEKVPTQFEHSAEWNQKSICPRGAELSPFMRYEMTANDKAPSDPSTHYFARTCNLVMMEGTSSETEGRKLASSEEPGFYVTPHGPVMRWHQNGRIMTAGRYENGTMQGTWKHYRPDGTMIVPQEGLLVAPFGD